MNSPLPLDFYLRDDVVTIAKELLGKYLFTQIDDDPVTGGMIIETEAYRGPEDRASHAYGNRRTKRTEVMFHDGGTAYVYLCYGIHHLLNVVTHTANHPHAVLIRAIQPLEGIETMLRRRHKKQLDKTLTSGPGSLCQALGITLKHNGLPFDRPPLWIEDRNISIETFHSGPRIGVDYAGEDALLPWRFWM